MKMFLYKRLLAFVTLAAVITVWAMCGCFAFASGEETGVKEGERTEEFTDFNDSRGEYFRNLPIARYFVTEELAGGSVIIDSKGAEGYAAFTMFSDIYVPEVIARKQFSHDYTIEADILPDNRAESAFYIRCIDPNTYAVENIVFGNPSKFWFYEWNWYNENGGQDGISGTGGSGVKVWTEADGIVISIKIRVEDGTFVTDRFVKLPFPEGFNAGGYNKFRFDDDGKTEIRITVNGTYFASVRYSGTPEPYPDGLDGNVSVTYYKKASVINAAGDVLLTTDKARICAEYSTFGFGTRSSDLLVDNLKISYTGSNAAEPVYTDDEPEETPKDALRTPIIPPYRTPTPSPAPVNVSEPSDVGTAVTVGILLLTAIGLAVIAHHISRKH